MSAPARQVPEPFRSFPSPLERRVAKILGFLSGTVAVASVAVYLATFVPGVRLAVGDIWPLPVAAVACVTASLLRHAWRTKRLQKRYGTTWDRARAVANVPTATGKRMELLYGAAFVFCGFNFILFAVAFHNGSPELRDGQFVLERKGRSARGITENEYFRLKAYELRLVAAGSLAFSLAPLLTLFRAAPETEV